MDKEVMIELTLVYKRIHMRLWAIEGREKIGATVDTEELDELLAMAASLEMQLRLPPRKANLI